MGSSSVSVRQEAHGIFSLRLYNQQSCRSIVTQALRAEAWDPALVGGAEGPVADAAVRDAWCIRRSAAPEIYDDFERRVLQVVRPAVRNYWECDLATYEGTQLIRYRSGGHFVPHHDADNYEYAVRFFTVLCYLNGGFEGGKTTFSSLNYTAAPVAGRALVFPSRFTHCAEPVVSGEKLVFVTWLCGPAPLRWI